MATSKSGNGVASDEGNGAVETGGGEEAGGAPPKRARQSQSQDVAAKADEDLTRSGLNVLSKVRELTLPPTAGLLHRLWQLRLPHPESAGAAPWTL